MLTKQHIILGVSGSIAAYKAATLTRLLMAAGAEVQVVMTTSATAFIGPLTLQALSGRKVRTTLLDSEAEASGMGHIELARWADRVLIAPASADQIAQLAGGRANDLLSAVCLATEAPILVAPAMNRLMWEKPSVQRNIAQIRADGLHVLPPDTGEQACGELGAGRMMEPEAICAHLMTPEAIDAQPDPSQISPLANRKVVITAGPTQEAIDPVRFLSNRSSGKQGFALAAACVAAGADVVLIAGPVALSTPVGVQKRIDVCTATQMYKASLQAAQAADLFIGVAAVADYRAQHPHDEKIKKTAAQRPGLSIELIENPDIISAIAALKPQPFVVGFAAETTDPINNAKQKLARKRLDMIIVNDVSRQEIGFGSDDNAVTLITAEHQISLAKAPKAVLSQQLVAHIGAAFAKAHPA